MALPKFGLPAGGAPASGMEMMLKSLGMGEAIEAAKALASNGTIEKIIEFSEGIGELNERLDRMERIVIAIYERGGEYGERSGDVLSFSAVPGRFVGTDATRNAEPDLGSAGCGVADFGDVGFSEPAAARRSRRAPHARVADGGGDAGASPEAPNGGGED